VPAAGATTIRSVINPTTPPPPKGGASRNNNHSVSPSVTDPSPGQPQRQQQQCNRDRHRNGTRHRQPARGLRCASRSGNFPPPAAMDPSSKLDSPTSSPLHSSTDWVAKARWLMNQGWGWSAVEKKTKPQSARRISLSGHRVPVVAVRLCLENPPPQLSHTLLWLGPQDAAAASFSLSLLCLSAFFFITPHFPHSVWARFSSWFSSHAAEVKLTDLGLRQTGVS
jgi:hypothetical protein